MTSWAQEKDRLRHRWAFDHPIPDPTPDQPEQEHDEFIRNEMRLGDELKKYEGRWVAVDEQRVVCVADSLDDLIDAMPQGATILGRVSSLPFFGVASPDQPEQEDAACSDPLCSYRGEVAVLHSDCKANPLRCDPLHQRIEGLIAEFDRRSNFSSSSIEGAICREHASRLRAVLKGET